MRIGIHSGEAAAAGGAVRRASRFTAPPGSARPRTAVRCCFRIRPGRWSRTTCRTGVFLRDLGLYRLKDVDRPGTDLAGGGGGACRRSFRRCGARSGSSQPVAAPPLGAGRSAGRRDRGGGRDPGVRARRRLGGSSGSVSTCTSTRTASARSTPRAAVCSPRARSGRRRSSVAAGAGSVWVTNPTTDTVSRIDPKTNARAADDPGRERSDGSRGRRRLRLGREQLSAGRVRRSTRTRTAAAGSRRHDPGGVGPSGVAFGVGSALGGERDRPDGDGVRARLAHARCGRFPSPAARTRSPSGFGFVWVDERVGNSVTRIDARSGTPLPAIAVGNGPTAIAVGAGSVWVANGLDGTVSQIDPPRVRRVGAIPVGGSLTGVAAGNGVVWVSDEPRRDAVTDRPDRRQGRADGARRRTRREGWPLPPGTAVRRRRSIRPRRTAAAR